LIGSGLRAGVARLSPELRGILLTVIAMLLFSCMDGISKFLVSHYPAPMVLWLRHVAAVPIAFLMFAGRNPFRMIRASRRLRWQIFRATLLAIEMNFVLLAFQAMPLADTHAILAATPLLVTALSVPLLGERVGLRRTLAVIAGFAGVLIILRPGLGVLQTGAVWALISTLLYAFYNIMTRRLAAFDSAETSFLLQIVIGAVVLTLVGPFYWVTPAPAHWPLVIAQATLGAFGHFLFVRALGMAPAVVIQPFTYMMLVNAVVLGYLLFGDVPDFWTMIGAAIVAGAGIYAAIRTHRRATGIA
jgi:drug/metabolite transporter (DMT)-like permease